jgi:carbamoyl-phosphate synthase/aspartate carbamoyltransferase/dihydroorotase
MLKSVRDLFEMGYNLYASKGTADFYQGKEIRIQSVEWPFEEGAGNASDSDKINGTRTIADFVSNRDFHLMINLPIRGSGAYRISAYRTHGYKTRRMAIDNG